MAHYLARISQYAQTVRKISMRYDQYGVRPYDGPITITNHSVQSARLASIRSGNEPLAVTCALLHDFGHIAKGALVDNKDDFHEYIGAGTLRHMGFPWIVCEPIKHHVNAKRFLVRDKNHEMLLSDDSKQLLKLQGGPMSDEEAELFRRSPILNEILELRKIDDMANDFSYADTDNGILEFEHEMMEALAIRDVEHKTGKKVQTWYPSDTRVSAYDYYNKAKELLKSPTLSEILRDILHNDNQQD